MSARLIVSVTASDDTADLLSFAEAVAGRGVPLSLLVRPVGPGGPLAFTSRLAGWLRERRARGDALVLHGYDHSRRPLGPQYRIRRAEFSALPAHEAALRLAAARWVTERAGLETIAFAPPGWRASAGTLTALFPGPGFSSYSHIRPTTPPAMPPAPITPAPARADERTRGPPHQKVVGVAAIRARYVEACERLTDADWAGPTTRRSGERFPRSVFL